jgi:hypothetical protein
MKKLTLTVLAMCAFTACTESPDSDGPNVDVDFPCDEPVEPDLPEAEPTEPPAPEAEEPWCGLETNVVENPTPTFPEDWTHGHPFEVGEFVGYAEVWNQPGWVGLHLHTFDEGNFHRTYSLSSYLLDETYPNGGHAVHDILIEGSLIHVLFSAVLHDAGGQMVHRQLVLATIDPANGLLGVSVVYSHPGDAPNMHQLAFDGGELIMGTYNVWTGSLSYRTLHRVSGIVLVDNDVTFARHEDLPWSFARFQAFDLHDGLATFTLSAGLADQTTRYRACE